MTVPTVFSPDDTPRQQPVLLGPPRCFVEAWLRIYQSALIKKGAA